jgi:tyrosyl-tRNA synthetase
MPVLLPIEGQRQRMQRGVTEIVAAAALVSKQHKAAQSGKPPRVKRGGDPSRPDLHRGHSVHV